MTETNEPLTEPTSAVATAPPPPPPPYTVVEPAPRSGKPNRLYQFAAWVAIVAGVVFIVAVIFFSGFALGRHAGGHGHSGGGGGWGHHHVMMWQHRMGPPMGGWQWQSPGGPGGGPGQGPQTTTAPRPS
jgi:hypothetical protein